MNSRNRPKAKRRQECEEEAARAIADKRRVFYDAYRSLHTQCPQCGKAVALPGFDFPDTAQLDDLRNDSTVQCVCGWSGSGHSLQPAPRPTDTPTPEE